ncbi:TPA: DUF551 domain-containing protein [Enterobacter hormaechei]|nr:DUF551 domain-containing protein [Enterobacter hormaechei]
MITFTKEQLIASAHARIEFAEMMLAGELEPLKERTWSIELELASIALASLELERGMIRRFDLDMSDCDSCGQDCGADMVEDLDGEYVLWDEVLPHLYRYDEYTATPAPASVPDGVLKSLLPDAEKSEFWFEHDGKILFEGVKFNNAVFDACRAVMLQGADGTLTNEGTMPVNQLKPVADLYGLTSPTGGETSFTFDAVEARDFIDGGWSCQEYVELGRFQEAMLQNGNSPAQSDCCPEQNYIAPAQDGNSPVIPDSWVACSERMPDGMQTVITSNGFDIGQGWWDGEGWNSFDSHDVVPGEVTHWMPLPAAPQQEA